jgi:hypothetical protein
LIEKKCVGKPIGYPSGEKRLKGKKTGENTSGSKEKRKVISL